MTGPRRPLDPDERVAWLTLARTPGLGALGFARLLSRFGAASAALGSGRLGRLEPPPVAAARAELAALADIGARLLCAAEPDYPPLLATLDPPPPVLAVRGDARLLARPAIAIVGARDASAAGRLFAQTLASDLGEAGLVVVSGLARGIDASAHRASLATGTIAVLAGGLDRPYPPQNVALYGDIVANGGAGVSEQPLGAIARARDFPRRNHIISGLATAVIVVEAAERSGSLITARAAAEQGRDVMAVPGSPLDPRARGSNALLKEGATLIESADDVLAALNAAPRLLREPTARPPRFAPAPADGPSPSGAADDVLTRRIQAALSPTPVAIDALARLLDAPVAAVAAALTELELAGTAETLPGGYAASSSRP